MNTEQLSASERDDLMNAEIHQKLIEALTEVRRLYPSFRLGQLLCALSASANSAVPDSIYDVEDEELLEAARSMIHRRTGVVETAAR